MHTASITKHMPSVVTKKLPFAGYSVVGCSSPSRLRAATFGEAHRRWVASLREIAGSPSINRRCRRAYVPPPHVEFGFRSSGVPGCSSPAAFPGGHRSRVTPVPIPNTEVKPATADGTAWVTVWESRSPPGFFTKSPLGHPSGLFPFDHGEAGRAARLSLISAVLPPIASCV